MLRRARQARPDLPWGLVPLALALIVVTVIAAIVVVAAVEAGS